VALAMLFDAKGGDFKTALSYLQSLRLDKIWYQEQSG
jgi:hypothetical protein